MRRSPSAAGATTPFARVSRALLAGVLAASSAAAQPARATVREYRRVFATYPFSDPDPIPRVGRIYPYFRFDGYAHESVEREWTVVELENPHLVVRILPEIGGKIWTAIDKASGRPFLYENGVVKFRDIAMRGPWTSGGIEANYGLIGHTPAVSTPVDYVAREHADGSASVVIGVLDRLTRTPWRLEVRLPADSALFTTRSLWHNATPLEQPYYTWMNAAIPAAGGLELVYPGTHFIGHDGRASPWPIDPETRRDLSRYDRNDFGPSKSYHVLGRAADFFGAFWHERDFGMVRHAPRAFKLGKKAWIWALSRQGAIWEDLLTDVDGQYVEVQSGRLFNQAAESSGRTPFKHRGFAPYATDTWEEHWFPVAGTKGLVAASPLGGLNVRPADGAVEVLLSPVRRLDTTLEVRIGDRVVFEDRVVAEPRETWARRVPVDAPLESLRVRLGSGALEWTGDPEAGALARPLEAPPDFDWTSVYGLHVAGRELLRQRAYGRAEELLRACLAKDPHYVPALADLAALRLRALDFAEAFALARRGLALDTYDPATNFSYGLAAEALGRTDDARDGFAVAAQSIERRAAAFTRLARLDLREGDLAGAAGHAARSLETAPLDLEALKLLALSRRLAGRDEAAAEALYRLHDLDPISHFARFERALLDGGHDGERVFVEGVRSEQPHETFLELATWYHGVGRVPEARRVLALAPRTPVVLYWAAFLAERAGDGEASARLLNAAVVASPRLAFPFRGETEAVLRWAQDRGPAWQPRYYRALLLWSRGDPEAARALLDECGDAPDFAPFYAARAALASDGGLADLERAARLDPGEWRFGQLLVEHHLAAGRTDAALEIARRAHAAHPGSHVLGMLHARALLRGGRVRETAELLSGLRVLPYEGASEGRRLHRETQLLLAVEALAEDDAERALAHVGEARLWPENLGVGKPYPDLVDERLEDWLGSRALARLGREPEATAALERLAVAPDASGAGTLLAALAARRLGREAEAERLLAAWVASAPDDPLAARAAAVGGGERPPLPEDASLEWRVLAAWLASGEEATAEA